MELKGKKVIILIEDLYNEFEFWYPYYRLKEAGVEVTVAGAGKEQYLSKVGLSAKADADAKDLNAEQYDGIIIPGGYAPDIMRRHPEMVELVKQIFDQGKVVAAICHAGWMLASAQILEGRQVTSYFAIKDDLIHAGAGWTDAAVVVDGKLITSRTPDDLPVFMKTVLSKLAE